MVDHKFLYPMEVRCAWCDTHMYYRSCHAPFNISHGICDECKKGVVEEIKAIRPAGTAKGA